VQWFFQPNWDREKEKKIRVGGSAGGWIGRALDNEQSFGIHDTASRLIDINWVWVATAALWLRCLSLLEGVAGFVDDH
jgi:hypothetical protein